MLRTPLTTRSVSHVARTGVRSVGLWTDRDRRPSSRTWLIFIVAALTGTARYLALELVLLTLLAVAAVLPVNSRPARFWRPPCEAHARKPRYLDLEPVRPFTAAVSRDASTVGWAHWRLVPGSHHLGATIAGLLLPRAFDAGALVGSDFVVDAVQWSLLSLAVGLLAAWVRRVQSERAE